MPPPHVTLNFDLLTLKMVPESRVQCANVSLPRPSVLDLGPMYAIDRQTDVRQHHRLMPPPRGRGIINNDGEFSAPAVTDDVHSKNAVSRTDFAYKANRSQLFI